jgi:hypothetical protein
MPRFLEPALDRAERLAGMPARHAVPALLGGTALQVAVLGMYWDSATTSTTVATRAC